MSEGGGVHAVVPYYRGHAYIERLVGSLRSGTLRPRRITIIDNGPVEDRLRATPVWNAVVGDDITLVETRPGIGFGRACNAGAAIAASAGATHVVVINQDAWVTPDALEHLVAVQVATGAALTGPVQLTPEGELSTFYARHYLPEALDGAGRVNKRSAWPQQPVARGMLSGACLLFPTSLVSSHGPFDPLYTMYGEDNDLARRVRASGLCSLQVPAAVIHHVHTNANATDNPVANLAVRVWLMEAGSVNLLRDGRGSIIADVARQVLRRAWQYGRELSLHGAPALPVLVASDRRLWERRGDLARARRGEPVATRAHAVAQQDLGEAVRVGRQEPGSEAAETSRS